MKFYFSFYLALIFRQLTLTMSRKIICSYDAASVDRKDLGQFTLADLENALEFCTHVIYGYVGINSLSLQIISLNAERDIGRGHFIEFMALKEKYPYKKFLLSLGGNKDIDVDLPITNKYIKLLEADVETQEAFIDSAVNFLNNYKFDGLDLAFQFPTSNNSAKEVREVSWKSLRTLYMQKRNGTNDHKIKFHKKQFTTLVENLRKALKPHDLMLSLTVLPHVNASLYLNASALIDHLDFINLQTFDFTTPELSPTEATYTAALYPLPEQGHANAQHNIEYHVNYWLSQRILYTKINIGIAAYGRAWRMTNNSHPAGFPKVLATNGPAAASYMTNIPGILTWNEICIMLPNAFNNSVNRTGERAALLSVLDPQRDFVTYAFRPADVNGEHGIWISYDDPRVAAIKAVYAKHRHLGGIAFYDVTLDDFRGICNGDTFPMLRYIKYVFT